ncbi:hypothetical protein Pcinc_024572 [Petrolisthes cinctipes]|uniref:Uncharacterized protein n=1 Tax=Petrolisthes cinctipes TaxID=88211 RepID=A0AAE1FB39_PETCI|nr:hypothetical protein Pcinc_024572 [Petrolisthes cinctipes]
MKLRAHPRILATLSALVTMFKFTWLDSLFAGVHLDTKLHHPMSREEREVTFACAGRLVSSHGGPWQQPSRDLQAQPRYAKACIFRLICLTGQSRPRREDDQQRQDSKRSNVGSDGSSSKRLCADCPHPTVNNHLAVNNQPAVNNVCLRYQAAVKLVRMRICLLRSISLFSPTY